MSEVYYLLACYGLTFALCDAAILSRPREFLCNRVRVIDELLSCYFCAGFWVSGALYLVLFGETIESIEYRSVAWAAAHAFAGAAFSFITYVIVDFLESVTLAYQFLVAEEHSKQRASGDPDGQ